MTVVDEVGALRQLEESLWRAETRFDREFMDVVLCEDFFEFGRSGHTYTREQVLAAPAQPIDAVLPLRSFQVHVVTADLRLVTYVSVVRYEATEVSNRSSLWIRAGSSWRLRFHQGTPAEK